MSVKFVVGNYYKKHIFDEVSIWQCIRVDEHIYGKLIHTNARDRVGEIYGIFPNLGKWFYLTEQELITEKAEIL
jgi:hypothetical protein